MSKNTVIGIIGAAVVVLAAIYFIRESNEGPIENAAEELDDAVDEIKDSVN